MYFHSPKNQLDAWKNGQKYLNGTLHCQEWTHSFENVNYCHYSCQVTRLNIMLGFIQPIFPIFSPFKSNPSIKFFTGLKKLEKSCSFFCESGLRFVVLVGMYL